MKLATSAFASGHCRPEQLHELLHRISRRVARFLERRGILERKDSGCQVDYTSHIQFNGTNNMLELSKKLIVVLA